jgi:GTP-dependent phosphoenolpyruvate carboxykinase
MCIAIYVLKKYPQTITNEEEYLLQDLVKKSKPTIFMKRYYRRRRFNDFYWTPYEMEPRIEWLNKQLKQLK